MDRPDAPGSQGGWTESEQNTSNAGAIQSGATTGAEAQTTPAIWVSHVDKVFGRRKVLDDINLEVPTGGFLSIFGPNGAGKTTLIKILSALVAPSSGEVRIAGLNYADDAIAVRRKIGLISHSPLLYPDLTAEENLEFYANLYQLKDGDERITELLEKVELGHRRYDLVRTFSRGMLQRLSIARALLHRPSILFLDEPHTGLDPHAVDILDGLLLQIRLDHTFVMITHNLDKGLELGDSAIVMDQGCIVYHADRRTLNREAFASVYRKVVRGEA